MATSTTSRAVVVDTTRSPFARLRPVAVDSVRLTDDFWAPRLRVNRETTLPSQYRLLQETGRIDNLLRAAGKVNGAFQGRVFNDSDVYKWLEAASWTLASGGRSDPELEEMIDEAVGAIEGAQQSDGYLNSYFSLDQADRRWTDFDLHEMYCAGHLFQAAVAHHRATGSERLLRVATRFADHIDATFGSEADGKMTGTDGHPEVELALVELARETGEPRYLALARYLVDVRGHGILGSAFNRFGSKYHQDHLPFRELNEIVGHAVRAVYLNAGVADIYAETGEVAQHDALFRLWESMTARKMYVSGGIGSRYEGESFGEDYELPNALAYTETCAAIGSAMWNWRMLQIDGDARYADQLELTLYNAILPGVSLDGQRYFYQNPLADEGLHRRREWFGTACCPPNVARTLASLPGYFYGVAGDEIWIHLFAASNATVSLPDGRVVEIRQETRYPWNGEITFEVLSDGDFVLRPRIPGWCLEATLEVNGEPRLDQLQPGTYAEVRRHWRPGDQLRLTLPMPVRRVEAHPYVEENRGRVALMRGPLLYCGEQIDNPEIDIRDIRILDKATFTVDWCPDLLGGVSVLASEAEVAPLPGDWREPLYRNALTDSRDLETTTASFTAVPYHAWANRAPGRMRVWFMRGD